ncbi:hypothetical protein MMC08_003432 [Hypocenomyce scalaris]|nr:hypothetical protein [Hypocenomyce scalaris]
MPMSPNSPTTWPPSFGARAHCQLLRHENTKHLQTEWHFSFQTLSELPEKLVAGNEMIYLKPFYGHLAQNPAAFSMQDLEF